MLEAEFGFCSPESVAFWRSLESLPSPSELLLALCGAEELVGVVISMGSPDGEGADIFIVGVGVGAVMIGIVRAPILSSVLLPGVFCGALSVATSIWSERRR